MARGRERADWTRTSRLMTLTANMQRKSPLDWDYFNPYREPPPELSQEQREAMVKAMFVKPKPEAKKAE